MLTAPFPQSGVVRGHRARHGRVLVAVRECTLELGICGEWVEWARLDNELGSNRGVCGDSLLAEKGGRKGEERVASLADRQSGRGAVVSGLW